MLMLLLHILNRAKPIPQHRLAGLGAVVEGIGALDLDQPSTLSTTTAASTTGTQLQTLRAASNKSRSGRKSPSHVKGYDRLLHQWAKMTASPSSSRNSSSTKAWGRKAQRPHAFGHAGKSTRHQQHTHQPSRKRHKTTGSGSSSWGDWYCWQDIDMTEAAAAARLHPDELHNLVFGRGSDTNNSSMDSKGKSKRQQRKEARRRARMLRKQEAAMGGAYAEFGFAWAQADDDSGPWYVSDTDSSSDDDEYMNGAYTYYTAGSRRQQQQPWQHHQQQQQQPDWQWWTEEQERQWFQQAWQQHAGGRGSSRHQQQQESQSRNSNQAGSDSSNGYYRPWWEKFEHRQQRQQSHNQQQRQQQWRQWGSGSTSGGSQQNSGAAGANAGAGSRSQQTSSIHPPIIQQHLSVLGLSSSTQLHKQQLKVAFLKAAMQWHPDKHPDAAAKAVAEARFKEVKASYEVLVQHVGA